MALRAVLLLALASCAFAATSFRHQFQYDLKPEHEGKIDEVIKRWKGFVEKAPSGGKPLLAQFGKDLGISQKLYKLNVNSQMDFAARLDFPSEAALRTFWETTRKDPLWIEMNNNWIQKASRIQYVANTCNYPAKGTYIRHSFQYMPKPNACTQTMTDNAATQLTSASVQKIVSAWYQFCDNAPAKPVSCVFGADLGIGPELYPTAGKTNMGFGGSLDFKNEADIASFWKWVAEQPLYKEITKDNLDAARVQYSATFN